MSSLLIIVHIEDYYNKVAGQGGRRLASRCNLLRSEQQGQGACLSVLVSLGCGGTSLEERSVRFVPNGKSEDFMIQVPTSLRMRAPNVQVDLLPTYSGFHFYATWKTASSQTNLMDLYLWDEDNLLPDSVCGLTKKTNPKSLSQCLAEYEPSKQVTKTGVLSYRVDVQKERSHRKQH